MIFTRPLHTFYKCLSSFTVILLLPERTIGRLIVWEIILWSTMRPTLPPLSRRVGEEYPTSDYPGEGSVGSREHGRVCGIPFHVCHCLSTVKFTSLVVLWPLRKVVPTDASMSTVVYFRTLVKFPCKFGMILCPFMGSEKNSLFFSFRILV